MKRLFLFLGRHCRIPIVAGNELFWPTHLALLRRPHERHVYRKNFLKLTKKPNFSNKNIFHARLNEPTNQTKKRLHKHTYPKKTIFQTKKFLTIVWRNRSPDTLTWPTKITIFQNTRLKEPIFHPKEKFLIFIQKNKQRKNFL